MDYISNSNYEKKADFLYMLEGVYSVMDAIARLDQHDDWYDADKEIRLKSLDIYDNDYLELENSFVKYMSDYIKESDKRYSIFYSDEMLHCNDLLKLLKEIVENRKLPIRGIVYPCAYENKYGFSLDIIEPNLNVTLWVVKKFDEMFTIAFDEKNTNNQYNMYSCNAREISGMNLITGIDFITEYIMTLCKMDNYFNSKKLDFSQNMSLNDLSDDLDFTNVAILKRDNLEVRLSRKSKIWLYDFYENDKLISSTFDAEELTDDNLKSYLKAILYEHIKNEELDNIMYNYKDMKKDI